MENADHKRRFPRLSALAAATICICGNVHAQSVQMSANVLEMLGIVPGPTYDPNESQIPRRRPGHPYEPPPEFTIQNPNGVPPAPIDQAGSFLPVPNRWRIMETLGYKFPWYDPYNQNIWKGDKPIDGKDHFLALNFISETVDNARSVPTPVGPQASSQPGQNDVLGRINQNVFSQTVIASADYYKGDTTFKPPEYEFKATLAFNYNRVDVQQVRAVQIDPRFGQTRDDGFIGVQELFYLKDLRTLDERFDFDEVRIGIQPFSSDFRGFLFQDSEPGVRFFGNRDNNRWQYNIAYFRPLEKDLNSGLNDVTKAPRHEDILLFNVYRQDAPVLGFTSQGIILLDHNRDSKFYDSNGFLERPAAVGIEQLRKFDVAYIGYNGDGHFGRLNLTASVYGVFGHQDKSIFVDKSDQIRAGFAAAEASMDFDWIRPRVSVAYASGDKNPYDNKSTGFDSVFENPIFAGADTSYWISQGIPLIGGGGVVLHGGNSLIPDLRSSKEQGQSNYDNPGLRLVGVGADFDLTPKTSRVGKRQRILVRQYLGARSATRRVADRSQHRHRCIGRVDPSSVFLAEHRFPSVRRRAVARHWIQESVRNRTQSLLLGARRYDSDLLRMT